jgi:DNA-binding SARP family transcriptional activator
VLRVRVFGRMVVESGGEEVPAPAARRAWSLLAYLALHPGPQPRGALAARFWPDVLDASARASLRSAVWSLRRALGPAWVDHLTADRDYVGLARDPDVWVDAAEFDSLVQAGRDAEAVALCNGDLLAEFDDDWVLSARDAQREKLLDALERLAAACEAAGDDDGAVEWSRAQVAADPLGEEPHRRLISRLAASGDRASALVVYRSLAERLRRELAVAPSQMTRELVQELREEPRTPARAVPVMANMLPLIGRTDELEQLLAAWGETREGRGRLVILRGEAGIGKTRLANELLVRAQAQAALHATCAALDLGGAAPFGLWAELISDLLPSLRPPPADAAWPEDLAMLVPELAARFGRVPLERRAAAPDLERARLFEATVALIEWAAQQSPLLLLIEDVHIADASSLELTGYVARRIAALAVMFVLTRRELPRGEDADRLEHALRSRGLLHADLALGPLSASSVADLACRAAALGDDDVARVVEAAEGNALLAVEAARALSRGEREPSAGLRGAVRGAFGSLSADARSFAEFAAVAARELERAEIDALPIEDSLDAAGAALLSGLLEPRGARVGFRHALLRDAVYADIPELRRASLHDRWSDTLLRCERAGGTRRAAEVARHLRMAGRDADAVEQLARAAADARAVAALPAAAEYLREALSMAPARVDLLLELGEVEAWRARRSEAEEAFARARRALEGAPPLELARALLRSARWYHGPICIPQLVRENSREALAQLDSVGVQGARERREALAALAWAEAIAGSVDDAEDLLAELHRLTAGEPPDDFSTYDIGHARVPAAMRRGSFTAAYAPSIAAGEAIARAGRPDLAYGCWANAAGAAAAEGDYDRALAFLDRCAAAISGSGLLSLEVHLLGVRSFVLRRVGRRADALTATEAERDLADRLGDPALLAMAAHDRGLVALEDGDFEHAASLLAAALAEPAPISRPLTRLARAEALARGGRLGEAEAELRETVLEPVRPSDFPETLVPRLARIQGLIAARAGDQTLAVGRLQEAVEGWRGQVTRLTRGDSMAAVLADLGRPVVGLVEPERELERVVHELETFTATNEGASHAVLS